MLLAIQTRLQQEMLIIIHVYGLLCDAVAEELEAQLG
jgi:hypothetical protein